VAVSSTRRRQLGEAASEVKNASTAIGCVTSVITLTAADWTTGTGRNSSIEGPQHDRSEHKSRYLYRALSAYNRHYQELDPDADSSGQFLRRLYLLDRCRKVCGARDRGQLFNSSNQRDGQKEGEQSADLHSWALDNPMFITLILST